MSPEKRTAAYEAIHGSSRDDHMDGEIFPEPIYKETNMEGWIQDEIKFMFELQMVPSF